MARSYQAGNKKKNFLTKYKLYFFCLWIPAWSLFALPFINIDIQMGFATIIWHRGSRILVFKIPRVRERKQLKQFEMIMSIYRAHAIFSKSFLKIIFKPKQVPNQTYLHFFSYFCLRKTKKRCKLNEVT